MDGSMVEGGYFLIFSKYGKERGLKRDKTLKCSLSLT